MLVAPQLVLASLVGVVQVSGLGTCPSPEDVAQRLGILRPAETRAAYRAWVDSTGPEVVVELRDAAGAIISRKDFKPGSSCADLAQACAVFLQAWAEQIRSAEPPGPELPAQVQPTPQAPPPEPPTSGLSWELGAAATLASQPLSGGGLIDVSVGSRTSALAIGLSVGFNASASVPLGAGTVSYTPLAARLGPRLKVALGPVVLEPGLALVGGVYLLEGQGFAVDQSAHGARAGIGLDLRVALPLGPVKLWVAGLGTGWLERTRIGLRGSAETTDLPVLELSGALGLSFAP
ncbi:MAG TPA: hypothetical protein VGK67_02900 [Myxococcales bacterium]|jgi:hypothetical protein